MKSLPLAPLLGAIPSSPILLSPIRPSPIRPSHEPWERWLLVALPAAWLLLLAIYGVRVALHGRYTVAALDRRSTSGFLPRFVLEFGYWLYQSPVRAFVRLGITADMLTLASLVITAIGALLIAGGRFGLGGWVLLLGFTCDVWDGMVARLAGTASRAGEFLDATLDRYSDLIACCGFASYYRDDLGALLVVLAALIGSTVVSYSRARGECLGIVAEVGYMRRYERAVWLGAGTVLSPLVASVLEPHSPHPRYHLALVVLALIAVLSHVTAIWRIRYILRALRR